MTIMQESQWRKSSRCGNAACVEVAPGGEGGSWMRDSKDPDGPVLQFTAGEWQDFVAGIRAGDFDL